MAQPPCHRSPTTQRDMRDMTGEEAFAARCAMSSKSNSIPNPPTTIKKEGGAGIENPRMPVARHPQATNVKLEPSEDGEIEESQPPHMPYVVGQTKRRGSSRASSNPLYHNHVNGSTPIAAYLSQDALPVGNHKRETPAPAINNNNLLSGLDPQDKLDRGIWLRPRRKSSQELQLMLSNQWSKTKADQAILPDAIRRVTHQFMVANGFVGSRDHLPKLTRKALWRSLLLRLDIHSDKPGLKGLSEQGRRLASAGSKLDQYIIRQSAVWLDMRVFTQESPHRAPQFHPCTQQWVLQSWDGQILKDYTHGVDALVDEIPSLNHDELLSIKSRVDAALTNFGAVPITLVALSEVRPLHDKLGQESTSARVRHPMEVLTKPPINPADPTLEERYVSGSALEGMLSYEREFSQVPESNPSKRGLPAENDPTTDKDWASLQHVWQHRSHSARLADSLRWGQSHAESISKYIDSTVKLLEMLGDSQHRMHGAFSDVEEEPDSEIAVTPPPALKSGRLYSPSQPPFTPFIAARYSPSQPPFTPFIAAQQRYLDAQLIGHDPSCDLDEGEDSKDRYQG